MMRGWRYVLALLTVSIWARGQGFHRYLDLHSASNFNQIQIRTVDFTQRADEILLRAFHYYKDGRLASSFSYFDHPSGTLVDNFVSNYGYTNLSQTFRIKGGYYLCRVEDRPFDLRAQWNFINLNRKREFLIPLDRFSLSDPYFRNDSVFIICSEQALNQSFQGQELDSSRKAYLCYFNQFQGEVQFLDSIIYPTNQRFGNLRYLATKDLWQITQDSLRIQFKNGQILRQFVDSNLFMVNFKHSNPYTFREVRNRYFREGHQRTFSDTMGAKLYHVWYREQDTLEYLLNFKGTLRNTENYNIDVRGFLGSLKAREDGIMDWMRYTPDNEIYLHRFEPNGAHYTSYFPQYQYPGYILYDIRSMPDGTFYIVGGGKRTNNQMKALIIKVDSNGVHKEPIRDALFQVHYNPQQDWLDLFYPYADETLWYEIWDMQGVMLHEGPVKSFEAMKIFRGSKGVHFVKLYSFDRQEYYGRQFFIRY